MKILQTVDTPHNDLLYLFYIMDDIVGTTRLDSVGGSPRQGFAIASRFCEYFDEKIYED
jgi:hypothetical protein